MNVEVDRAAVLARYDAVAAAFAVDRRARFVATLDYFWEHLRTGVACVVAEYRLRLMVPFCNRDAFVNAWGTQLAVDPAIVATEPTAVDRWWANAGLVCTRPQGARGWTLGELPAYRAMIEAALAAHPVRHAVFFLNRRDSPCVRSDGRHPWAHVWRGPPPVIVDDPGQLLPVLSPYTCAATFVDRLIPCAKDLAAEAAVPLPAWEARRPVAFWRGTATNPLRVALVDLFRDDPRFDVALTRSRGGRLRCADGSVTRTPPSGDAGAFVAPAAWTAYRVCIVVDGHSGCNRWLDLVRSGAHIVNLSGGGCAAPDTLLAGLVPHDRVDGTAADWPRRLAAVVSRRVRGDPPPRPRPSELRRRLLASVAASID